MTDNPEFPTVGSPESIEYAAKVLEYVTDEYFGPDAEVRCPADCLEWDAAELRRWQAEKDGQAELIEQLIQVVIANDGPVAIAHAFLDRFDIEPKGPQ